MVGIPDEVPVTLSVISFRERTPKVNRLEGLWLPLTVVPMGVMAAIL